MSSKAAYEHGTKVGSRRVDSSRVDSSRIESNRIETKRRFGKHGKSQVFFLPLPYSLTARTSAFPRASRSLSGLAALIPARCWSPM